MAATSVMNYPSDNCGVNQTAPELMKTLSGFKIIIFLKE